MSSYHGDNPSSFRTATLADYEGLSHAPGQADIKQATGSASSVKELYIKVNGRADGAVPAFLHLPASLQQQKNGDNSGTSTEPLPKTAAILVSGAGGGVVGPSSMYLSLADKLASLRAGLPVMRLDFRYPARTTYCVADLRAAISHLSATYQLERFVLVGWSFGGAVVFSVGAIDQRVCGVATVASQTAEAGGIAQMPPRPVLLLHGTGDHTLSSSCSERLYTWYGGRGDCRLELFKGADHALTRNSVRAEQLLSHFILRCAGYEASDREDKDVLARRLMGDEEKVEKMKRGGDLRGKESIA